MSLEEPKVKKAYSFTNEYEAYTQIDWFETAGKAKASFANEHRLNFCDVRVNREPWADKYQSEGEIPPEAWLSQGLYTECYQCGVLVTEENLGEIDGVFVYCNKCRPKDGKA